MGLDKIRGQDRALRTVGFAMEKDRFHHAYRFEGPDGVGKELTALSIAKVLNCKAGNTLELGSGDEAVTLPDFCGTCGSCHKIGTGNHPDVMILAALKGKATIAIKQIRELHGFVLYPPSEGEAKVIIVRDADKATEEAANAFLKMLEEPPPRTHFFLVTARPHKLLPTIMSRTVPVRFSPLGAEDMKAVLEEIVPDQPPGEIENIAAMSGGSVSAALARLSEEWNETLEQVVKLDQACSTGVPDLVEFLDDITLNRDETQRLLSFLEMWYRDVAYLGITHDREGLMLPSLADAAVRRAETLPSPMASAMALKIPEHRALLEGYVNPRMVIERMYMEFRKEEV